MRRRPGFTIVEMLVSMALILFIMAIISEAFVAGLDSLKQLKSIGDLDMKLRTAASLLRHDLRADHFADKRLSQQALPPPEGFFRIYQGSASTPEGSDADGIPSSRSADSMLHFTIKLKGALPDDFMSAPAPAALANTSPLAYRDGANFYSQFAEVAYFLRPTGTTTGGTVSLYSLHRRQRLASQSSAVTFPNNSPSPYPDLSAPLGGLVRLNTPANLTLPANRLQMLPSGRYPAYSDDSPQAFWGADLVLLDVISFEVKLSTGGNFADLFDPLSFPPALIQNPLFKGAGKPRVFDTWSGLLPNWNVPGLPTSLPLKINVKALQISIRVWDQKAQRTRQVTVVQDM